MAQQVQPRRTVNPIRAHAPHRAWLAALGLVTAIGTAAQPAGAEPQVVAVAACTHDADDIAAFATCEGDKVVRPEAQASFGAPENRVTVVLGPLSMASFAAGGRLATPNHRSKGATPKTPRR